MVCHVCNTERSKTVPGLQGRIISGGMAKGYSEVAT